MDRDRLRKGQGVSYEDQQVRPFVFGDWHILGDVYLLPANLTQGTRLSIRIISPGGF